MARGQAIDYGAIGCSRVPVLNATISLPIYLHTPIISIVDQLCGDAIVDYLRDSNKSFPYSITVNDVYTVFSKDELRQNIRDRFLSTLRLDPRYEVIAYAIAYAISQDSTGGDTTLANGGVGYGFCRRYVVGGPMVLVQQTLNSQHYLTRWWG